MATFEALSGANKRNSLLLVAIFVLVICGMGGVLGWLLTGDPWAAWPSVAIALFASSAVALIGYYGGSGAVLAMSGAREIRKQDDPQLWNVTEELALAGGLPMPKVHLIETPAMNAFATGRDPEHAHVAVTRGLRDRLTRDELQGVIAHELSHVKGYDIRFMTMMAVLVGTVVLLADIALRSLLWGGGGRRRRSAGGGSIGLVLLLVALVFAILAPPLAKLIQLAASRQREFLADAEAARLTRYPEGLARALEKLGADTHPMRQASRATAHMFIVQPMMARGKRSRGGSVWSSHPPIEERVERLRSIGIAGA